MTEFLTEEQIADTFEEHRTEFIEFSKVQNPENPARDLCALLILARVCPLPRGSKAIAHADHDEVFLEWGVGDLAGKITAEDVIRLLRCGVHCDGESLQLFP